jgi:hypothetical protein
MKIIPLGGAEEIGATYTLIEIGGHNLLIDAGIRMGSSTASSVDPIPDFSRIDDFGGIEAILVTHAHIDHTGSHRSFPNEPIYTTPNTQSVVSILFRDALNIMRSHYETERDVPPYTKELVESLFTSIHPVQLGQTIFLFGGDVAATFFPAGYVLDAPSIARLTNNISDSSGGTALLGAEWQLKQAQAGYLAETGFTLVLKLASNTNTKAKNNAKIGSSREEANPVSLIVTPPTGLLNSPTSTEPPRLPLLLEVGVSPTNAASAEFNPYNAEIASFGQVELPLFQPPLMAVVGVATTALEAATPKTIPDEQSQQASLAQATLVGGSVPTISPTPTPNNSSNTSNTDFTATTHHDGNNSNQIVAVELVTRQEANRTFQIIEQTLRRLGVKVYQRSLRKSDGSGANREGEAVYIELALAVPEICQLPQVRAILKSLQAQTGWEIRVQDEPNPSYIREVVEQALRQDKASLGLVLDKCSVLKETKQVGLKLVDMSGPVVGATTSGQNNASIDANTSDVDANDNKKIEGNSSPHRLDLETLQARFTTLTGGAWQLSVEITPQPPNSNRDQAIPINPNQLEIIRDLLARVDIEVEEFVDQHLGGKQLEELTKNEASKWTNQLQQLVAADC